MDSRCDGAPGRAHRRSAAAGRDMPLPTAPMLTQPVTPFDISLRGGRASQAAQALALPGFTFNVSGGRKAMKASVFVGTSLDGYLACPDGALDFFFRSMAASPTATMNSWRRSMR